MLLDTTMIKRLRKALQRQYRDGMDIKQFTTFVINCLSFSDQCITEVEIAETLFILFKRIDVYDTGIMTWDSLASHVVGYSSSDRKTTKSGIREYKKSHRNTIPNKSPLEHMFYFEPVDILVTSDTNGKCTFINGTRQTILKTMDTHSSITCATYIRSLDYIVIASHDQTIAFYDTLEFEKRQQLPMPVSQSAVAWHEDLSRMYAGGVNGTITCWDVERLVQIKTSNKSDGLPTLPALVTEIIVIDAMAILACSCLDGNIHLIDLHSSTVHRKLSGHHHGVLFLRYSLEYRYIVSGGIDHSIRIWNPFVKSNVIILRGHRSQLVGIEIVSGTPEVLTADEAGIVKVWDIRTFKCTQTINSDSYQKSRLGHLDKILSCITFISPLNSLAVGYAEVSLLEATWEEQLGSKSNGVLRVLYYKSSATILTATKRNVQIWDAKTGVVLKIYNIELESDVSAVASFGPPSFILGSETGVLAVRLLFIIY